MLKTPRVLDSSDPGCVSADTEFLTPIGWKRIDEYLGGPIAQFDPVTRNIEWVIPLDYVKLPCTQMVAISPVRGTSQRLSEEHRVLYYTADGEHAECSAAQFMEDLHRKGAAHFGRKFATSFRVSGRKGMPYEEAQLRLMVAVIADGHFHNNTTKKVYVRLKKKRKIDRLRATLFNAGIPYTERTCGGQPDFQVFRFDAPWNAKHFGADWGKQTNHNYTRSLTNSLIGTGVSAKRTALRSAQPIKLPQNLPSTLLLLLGIPLL